MLWDQYRKSPVYIPNFWVTKQTKQLFIKKNLLLVKKLWSVWLNQTFKKVLFYKFKVFINFIFKLFFTV